MATFTMNTYCDQRRRRALIPDMNLAKQRFELLSPYTNSSYTKYDFDMRRKAEILKYNANASSTKTNNPTKSQLYSSAMKGYGSFSHLSPAQLKQLQVVGTVNGKVVTCGGQLIKTPLSASNVPPTNSPYYNTKYLYDDENVTLYLYGNQTETYAIQNPPLLTNFYSVTGYNTIAKQDTSGIFATIGITEAMQYESYTFTISLPISIQIDGSINTIYPTIEPVVRIKINPVLNVYYSSDLVIASNYSYSLPDSSFTLVDISANTSLTYSATQYIGNLSINNVSLYTQPTYIYDFYNSLNISVNKEDSVTTCNVSIIYNPTINQTSNYSNCRFSVPSSFPSTITNLTIE